MNRWTRLTGVAIVAAAAVAVGLVLALGDDGNGSAGRCTQPGPVVFDPDTGRTLCGEAARRFVRRQPDEQLEALRELYGLTPASERAIRRVITGDRVLRTLLRGKRYRIGQLHPLGGPDRRLTGVATQIYSATPITASAVVPTICGRPPSRGGRLRVTMQNVSRLRVIVDVATGRVVDITPNSYSGKPRPKVTATLLPGSVACPKSGD